MKREIIVHKSLASCLKSYGINGDGYWKWMDAEGKTHKRSHKVAVRSIRRRRCWAYISNKSEIHMWVGKGCNRIEVFRVLAHEMGHAERPFYRSLKEEQKAAKYERVAVSAYSHVDKVIRKSKRA